MTATALIAEDEPLLLASLRKQLREAWPELRIVAEAGDGELAVALALETSPDVLFLDIRMPGRSGLAVAEAVVDEWPETKAAPLIVFVTAYDEFALAAFERAAVDYVLKPVTPDRIARTVERLRSRLDRPTALLPDHLAALVGTLQSIATTQRPDGDHDRLDVLQVGRGNVIAMVPVGDVLFFEATDKYVAVHTRGPEGLIRMSMRDLVARLDPRAFVQVHRSIVVARTQITAAIRDDLGRVVLKLRDSPRELGVSRAFAHLFKPM